MPKAKLSKSHRMTMGAKEEPILEVPNGWMANSSTRMAQLMPTMVRVSTVGQTTFNPVLFGRISPDQIGGARENNPGWRRGRSGRG